LVVSVSSRPPPSIPFPTRRSSDLEQIIQRANPRGNRSGLVIHYPEPSSHPVDPVDTSSCSYTQLHTFTFKRQKETVLFFCADHKDRKSTRLNSSHVKISYAVFCFN